jgi:histone H3/H4
MSVESEPRPAQTERNQAEIESAAQERLQELAEKSPEQTAENQSERAEQAREVLAQHEQTPEPAATADRETPTSNLAATLDRVLNYKQTMASVQRRLSPASRRFSKVIHNKAVESTSEALEKTIMRPSVTLGATWTALIVGSIFYLTAHYYGYRLSGFEMLGALIIGGIIGITLELIFRPVHKKHR